MYTDAIEEHLKNWNDAIPEDWKPILGEVRPAQIEGEATNLDSKFVEQIYPPLQNDRNEPQLFSAMSPIPPKEVRVVMIGRDPYPEIERATGRAFEDWGFEHLGTFSRSIKGLLASAMALDPQVAEDGADYVPLKDAVAAAADQLPNRKAMSDYFDGLSQQGVLFLNASWTRARLKNEQADQQKAFDEASLDVWRPVMKATISWFQRMDSPPVYLVFGTPACHWFDSLEVVAAADKLTCSHPSYWPQYRKEPNPLLAVNNKLIDLKRAPVTWWPPLELEGG